MPSFLIPLLARGSDSLSLLDNLMDLTGSRHPLPDFSGDHQRATDRLDIVAKRLNSTWFPSSDMSKCGRHIEVATDLELAAALDLLERSNWCSSPMYFLGGDDRQVEIVEMDANLEMRWKTICSDQGVHFESGIIHMEPFPSQYLSKFAEVSDDLLAYEILRSLLELEVVKIDSVDQLTFIKQLMDKEPNWNFKISIVNDTERQALEELAEEYNMVVTGQE